MFKISVDQINKLLQYLAEKPFKESFQLINMLQTLEPLQTPLEEESKDAAKKLAEDKTKEKSDVK